MQEWCRVDLGLEYGQAVFAVLCFGLISGSVLRALDKRLAPGSARLVAVLPIVLGNCVAAKLFCRGVDATTIILVGFNTMWLSSFKALAWALNRGALADAHLTPPQFVVVYMAPLTPKHENSGKAQRKGRLAEDAGGAHAMLAAWLMKLMVIAVALAGLLTFPSMPGVMKSFLLTWGLYGLLSSIMDGPAVLLTGLMGLHLSPHFDRPWLSNSAASWWNKRWDLAAGNTLRVLVFDPIVEGRLVYDPKVSPALNNPWRQLAGTTASFLTSGLIHELLYWYIVGTGTGGYWISYFLVQVPLIVFERLVLSLHKRRGVVIPNLLRIVVTIGVQNQLGHWLFWPPVQGAVTQQVIANLVGGAHAGVAALRAVVKP